MFKFIHCADLHLGCAPHGLRERYNDFEKAFSQAVDLALQQKVQAFLISGDLFHQRAIDSSTLSIAVRQLMRLKHGGINVIAVEGNHDKALYIEKQSWMQYLQHEKLFSLLAPIYIENKPILADYDGSAGSTLILDGVRFVGLGYLGGSTKTRLLELSDQLEPFDGPTITLLHAAVNGLMDRDMAGIPLKTLQAFTNKVDYFAMGHIHTRQEYQGMVFNPGAPESVHLDEAKGEKGFYLAEIHGKEIGVNFIPAKHRQIICLKTDATGLDAEQTAHKVVESAQKEIHAAGAIASIIIYGSSKYTMMDTTQLEQKLLDLGFLYIEIDDRTSAISFTEKPAVREDIEIEVLSQLAEENGLPSVSGEMLLSLKEHILLGESPENLFEMLSAELSRIGEQA